MISPSHIRPQVLSCFPPPRYLSIGANFFIFTRFFLAPRYTFEIFLPFGCTLSSLLDASLCHRRRFPCVCHYPFLSSPLASPPVAFCFRLRIRIHQSPTLVPGLRALIADGLTPTVLLSSRKHMVFSLEFPPRPPLAIFGFSLDFSTPSLCHALIFPVFGSLTDLICRPDPTVSNGPHPWGFVSFFDPRDLPGSPVIALPDPTFTVP